MHRSLSPNLNLTLIALWAIVVVSSALAVEHFNRVLMLSIGSGFGLAAGFCQLHALRNEAHRFRQATTAPQVRSAMLTARWGRYSIYLLWACAAVLATCMVARAEGQLFGFVGGYAAFSLLRDLVSLKGCIDLSRGAMTYASKG